MKFKLWNCSLVTNESELLGHISSKDGIRTGPRKTKEIAEATVPANKPQLGSVLGLASFYRRLMQRFAKTAAPLHDLKGAKAQFQWNSIGNGAFEELKLRLTRRPILLFLGITAPFCRFYFVSEGFEGKNASDSVCKPNAEQRGDAI